jgi:hypothetical protein
MLKPSSGPQSGEAITLESANAGNNEKYDIKIARDRDKDNDKNTMWKYL